MHGYFVHRDIHRAVERSHREVRQVDLVDLIEDLLTHGRVGCGLLLREQLVQSRIAVEHKIGPGRRELVAGKQRRVIGIVGP